MRVQRRFKLPGEAVYGHRERERGYLRPMLLLKHTLPYKFMRRSSKSCHFGEEKLINLTRINYAKWKTLNKLNILPLTDFEFTFHDAVNTSSFKKYV